MAKTFTALGVAFAPSFAGAAEGLGAPPKPPPVDANVVNTPQVEVTKEIVPVRIYGRTNIPVFDVPADKLLVIEDASASADLEPGQKAVITIVTTVNDVTGIHAIGHLDVDLLGFDRVGREMKVYADPGYVG